MIQRRARGLSINEVASALGVARVTIDRAIASGQIIPTFRTPGGRARFDREYVDELQRRAAEVRAHGEKRVIRAITPPPAKPKPQMSASRFAALTAWKRTVLRRTPPR